MHLRKNSQSCDSTDNDAFQADLSSDGQADGADHDVMCLVYPDGRTTIVVPQPNS